MSEKDTYKHNNIEPRWNGYRDKGTAEWITKNEVLPEIDFSKIKNVMRETEDIKSKTLDKNNTASGIKHDTGKIDWTLIPWKSLALIVEVLMIGATKYAPENWKKVEPNRYKKALLRHVIAYVDGEELDPETEKSHLAHAGCNILFLLWFWLQGKDNE